MTKLEQKQAELIEWYQRNSVTVDTEQSKDLKSEIAGLKAQDLWLSKRAKDKLTKATEEFLDKRLPYQQNKNLHYMEVYEEVLEAMEQYGDLKFAEGRAISLDKNLNWEDKPTRAKFDPHNDIIGPGDDNYGRDKWKQNPKEFIKKPTITEETKKYILAKDNMEFLAILTEWCTAHHVSFSGKETAVITSAMEQYRTEGLREELYNDLGEWTKNVFPDADSVAHLFKLKDETEEAIKTPNDIMEYADCLMAIFGASYKAGFTYDELMSACKDKLVINKTRKWVKGNNNTYQHT